MANKSSEKARRRRGRKSGEHPATNKEEINLGGQRSLLIQFTEDATTWYECGKQTPGRDATIFTDPPPSASTDFNNNNKNLVQKYRSEADELYRSEIQLFNRINAGSSDDADERWLENTMKRGTLKDRIAAMSVVVSTNPVHKLHALDGLLQMAGCSETGGQTNARMALLAAEALEDLFVNTLLPRHRKLVSLEQRPLYLYESDGKKTLSPRVLLLWRYEEMIKERYQQFLRQYLTQTLRDGLEMSKLHALRSAGTLLRSVPEAEDQVLSMMVNKLGDPAKKTASAAGHELRRVLEQHPSMQVVIAREVQQLAHRPHLSPRALYNCIIFLNQLKLEREEAPKQQEIAGKKKTSPLSLPASLVRTYFRLFEVAVKQNTEKSGSNAAMQGRLLSALLTGVNRAHPYLPDSDKDLDMHIDSLYRVVFAAPAAASTQALMLLFLVAASPEEEDEGLKKKESKASKAKQDRFYRALYATLSQPSMVSSGKHLTMYFNLLYKAMKHDLDEMRVQAFAKRLLCSTMHCSPSVTAASLFLLNEIMKYHPQLQSGFAEVVQGDGALLALDPLKREPAVALVAKGDGDINDAGNTAPLWETSLIGFHFHPSVAKFTSTLGEISYAGDPLRDFALAPFLDKFAYRNPKTTKRTKSRETVAARRNAAKKEYVPMNDPSFLQKDEIGEQDEFFHRFFVERARRDEIKGISRGTGADVEENDELDALDIAESTQLDHNVHFEEGWDTDPEEEAFVDQLAAKLMDDTMEDFDDEDPDMEDWDDLYSDDDDELGGSGMQKNNEGSFEEDASQEGEDQAHSDDMDAFMDEESDSEQSEGVPDDEASSGEEDDLALVEGTDDDEADEEPKDSKTNTSEQTFSDATEYQEIIDRAWNERKRTASFDGISDEDKFDQPSSAKDKKRKRKRKRKH